MGEARERIGKGLHNGLPLRLDGLPDDTLLEVELGAMREIAISLRNLREKLETLEETLEAVTEEHRWWRDVIETGRAGAHPPTEKLRANGVTRYKRGKDGVEIELSQGPLVSAPGLEQWLPKPEQSDSAEPWPGAFEQLGKAAREAGYLKRHPAGEPPAPPAPVPGGAKRCPSCGELANLHYLGSECLGCDRCRLSEDQGDHSRDASPADEQPPVEIDMAAVDELIKEQHAKRRGASQ